MEKKFSNFVRLWVAGLISAIGSGFTGYGLGVWIYMQTGEVTKYSMISVVTTLPGILIGFFAGVFVDFYDRKKTMLICDIINFLLSFTLLTIMHLEILELWHIYIILSIISTLAAIRWSAYAASIVTLINEGDLKRANGMDQFTNAASQIFPPIFAAIMVNSFLGIKSVILIDVISYLISIILIAFLPMDYKPPNLDKTHMFTVLKSEFTFGLKYLWQRKALIGLLGYMSILNYISGGVSVLFSPMVLSFASSKELSIIMAIAGFGMVFGSAIIIFVKAIKLNTATILIYSLVFSGATILAGMFENFLIICVAGFVFFTAVAIVGSAFQYVFQREVPPNLQGRIFSVRKTIVTSTLPLSYISLSYLADNVFIPFVKKNSFLSSLGDGNSRGIGLLLIVLGTVSIGFLLLLYYKLDIKKLDKKI